MKPHLKGVTLVAIDTTDKAHLAERAIEKSLEQCSFDSVKLLTHRTDLKYWVQIPRLNGLEGYSNFCIRELHKHFQTSHCLLVQYDGYVLNGKAWTDEFLSQDYIGAPSWGMNLSVGNGGFSLRSKRLCMEAARTGYGESAHPEDAWLCIRHRNYFESKGLKFAPQELAKLFSFEGRSYDGQEWRGTPNTYPGSFGFHSWLTPLPDGMDKPTIFHHTGDTGDIIYSLAVMKALGGGVLFISPDSRHPYPRPCRVTPNPDTVHNIACLANQQDYVWNTLWTHGLPFSTDVDFNSFREFYRTPNPDNFASLFSLHQKPFGITWPSDNPWLTVNDPISIPDKPIVVNRTLRFRNDHFPWHRLIEQYGHKMVFVGTEEEHGNFNGFCLPKFSIPHFKTATLLQMAQVIAGSKVFIGNQSAPLAVAHGLCHNAVVETWPANPNCSLPRPNAIYCGGNTARIPEEWLA